jgi:fido (protein-threonine AMPylation protein)
MSYKDTSLWKGSLGKEDMIVEPLRESYLDARKNAEFLLDKIRKDFPNLTVHDITHVDSLWNVADTIIGEDYPINPLEGYILGIAFLIHDAALSYDAVGGKDKLRDTIEWKDAYADGPDDEDEEEFKKECDFAAIRALHAKYAEDILNKKFERDNTTTFYIIDNDEYRTQFGDMIGKIAASHHWSIDEVESKLENQVNPVAGLPSDWEINEQKLACILRCADAGHIDNGRAPYGIYNSLIVNGVSRDHWESQTRLGQVRENKKNPEKLLITSTRPFTKDNFAAWNVAYDAVKLFDEELKKSNELLKSESLSFHHIGVTGAESKEALSEYIKTNGWLPCSFGVHTSNVKALIENLGGSKLYGENNMLMVALRELIQNARDAIQARRMMDGRFEEGRITIRLKIEDKTRWIEVEDDGIGMSLDCIKNNLLDFGSSYWKSNLAKYENPGLRSKRFKSIGKFGIGFYSVFMVAKSVEVISRRYKDGEEAKKIEFPEGLTLSPILSDVKQNTNVSTLVKFELKNDVDMEFVLLWNMRYHMSLTQVLSTLVVGLDVDVYFDELGVIHRIHSNVKSASFDKKEWIRSLFIDEPENIDELASGIEQLTDEYGCLRGLLLPPEWVDKINYSTQLEERPVPCFETIGGLSASLNLDDCYIFRGYIGYVDGVEGSISRNMMVFDKKYVQTWAKGKYNLNYNDIIVNKILCDRYCRLIHFCGIQDDIVNDNMKHLFSTELYRIPVGRMVSLRMIHLLLFAGVYDRARELKSTRESIAEKILALLDRPNERGRESLFADIIDPLVRDNDERIEIKRLFSSLKQISKMPTSNYEEIMYKYYELIKCHPFYDGNSRTVGVWVNLLLNEQCNNKVINWEKVDLDYLKKLIGDNDYLIANNYLKQFIIPISTYIAEMNTQRDEKK